jgi:Acyl-CoA dehydrogenase, C-terminal domain
MSPRLTADQIELQRMLRDFLNAEFQFTTPQSLARARMQGQITLDAVYEKLKPLALDEYFGAAETSCPLGALGVVALEAGYALVPAPLATQLLMQVVFPKLYPALVNVQPLCYAERIEAGKASYVSEISEGGWLLHASDEVSVYKATTWLECPAVDKTQQFFAVDLGAVKVFPELPAKFIWQCVAILRALELCGLAERAIAMTSQYVKERQQFAVPVGGFQLVQARMAEMLCALESCTALARFALFALEDAQDQSELAVKSALYSACDQLPEVIESAIQLHGGIGFTWEYDLHLLLRRAKMIAGMWAPDAKAYAALSQLVV